MSLVKIAPSLMAADFKCLERDIKELEEAGADLYHMDIMDGHFVPNITFGPLVIEAVRELTKKPIESHLMIENPERYIEAFARAGSDIIIVHIEIEGAKESIVKIKSLGLKAGIAINPETEVEKLEEFKGILDHVLVMSVHPGFYGQKFIEDVLEKFDFLGKLKETYGISIGIDGGINSETIWKLKDKPIDVVVSGSFLLKTRDKKRALQELKKPFMSR